MFSKKDRIHIAFRNWKGESHETIAEDYNITKKGLAQVLRENKAEIAHLEAEFRSAEIERLSAEDPIRKAHYGFVLQAYAFVRSRAQLPKAILEFSQESDKPDAHLHTLQSAETVLESFEDDFGITLI